LAAGEGAGMTTTLLVLLAIVLTALVGVYLDGGDQ
jgi:hypothetical protein